MPFFRDIIDEIARRGMQYGVDPAQVETTLYPQRVAAEAADVVSEPIVGAGRAILGGIQSVLPEAITGATPQPQIPQPIVGTSPKPKQPVPPVARPSVPMGPPKPSGEVMATIDGRTADYTGTAHSAAPGPLAGALVDNGRVAGYGRELMASPGGAPASVAGEVEQVHAANMGAMGRQLDTAKAKQELQFATLTPEQKAQLIQAQKTPTTGEDAASGVRSVFGTPEEFIKGKLEAARALAKGQPFDERAVVTKAQTDYFNMLNQQAESLRGKGSLGF